MKKFPLILSLILVISLLAGCAGTPVVYYTDCTCPPAAHEEVAAPAPTTAPEAPATEAPAAAEGALKTGMAIVTSLKKSASATADAAGKADYDVTMVAVLVDDNGIIQDCIIDGIASSVEFDATGAITTDLAVAPQTKNEKGDAYGMRGASKIGAEWNEQAAAVAATCVGKHYGELKGVVVAETGYAPEGTDLASSATIYIGGYVQAIELAAANAQHLGAQAGDTLKMATITGIGDSKSADAENAGNAQLNVDVTALTMNGDVITSCYIDSVQAKVAFDATGAITTDLAVAPQTKNELGAAYNMVLYGKAKAEWNEQAASFAKYVTGKTPAQVAGINVAEDTKPTDADLLASVTIKVGGFMDLIAKACK